MIRSFLPVGQGAFYCEQFLGKVEGERINVVYDCGSLQNKALVEKRIKGTFKEGEVIHAMFISHLDEDHINGIPFLLKYCNVKKIFFPLLTEKNKKIIKLRNLVQGIKYSDFALAFMENPYQALQEMGLGEHTPLLYQVGEHNQEDEFNGIDARVIESGDNVAKFVSHEFGDDWVFVPYNFRQESRLEELDKALQEQFEERMDNDDLLELWMQGETDVLHKIRAAYKKVSGSFNTNSMTLFSGTLHKGLIQYIEEKRCLKIHRNKLCMCYTDKVGCLYTGDYDASGKQKWRQLKEAYNTYWNYIGCVQIPHHGSRHNYNKELAEIEVFHIVSAGNIKGYNHPHGSVIKDLVLHGRYPLIVTEEDESIVRLHIRMW